MVQILVSRLLLSAVGFYCGVLLAKILGPADLGAYGQVLSTAAILSVVICCGAEITYNVKAAQREVPMPDLMSVALLHVIVAAPFALGLAFVVGQFSLADTGLVVATWAATLCLSLFQLAYSVVSGSGKQAWANILLASLILVQPVVVFLAVNTGAWPFASAIVTYCLVYAMFFTSFGRQIRLQGVFSVEKRRLLLSSITTGRHALLANFAGVARLRGQVIVLGMFGPPETVAVYFVAQTLTELLYIVPTAIGTTILSLGGDPLSLRRSSLRYGAVAIGLTLIGVCVLALSAEVVVDILYGPQFVQVAQVLPIMLIAAIAYAFAKSSGAYLYRTGRAIAVARVELFAVAAFLVISPLLVPRLGLLGAAISFAITAWLPALVLAALALMPRAVNDEGAEPS